MLSRGVEAATARTGGGEADEAGGGSWESPQAGGGDRRPPVGGGGARGSWSLIRQPAARGAAHHPDSRDSEAWSLSLRLRPSH